MPPFELLILLVAAGVFTVWVRWLWKSTRAPRALCVVPAVLTALIASTAVASAYGTWASLDAVGGDGDSSQKTKELADGVALAMTSAHYGTYACVACAAVLVGLTWQYHWSRARTASPPPAD